MDVSSTTEARLREIDRLLEEGGVRRGRRLRLAGPSIQESPQSIRSQGSSQNPERTNLEDKLVVLRVPGWSQPGRDGARTGNVSRPIARTAAGNRAAMAWLVHGFSTRAGGRTRIYRPEASAGGDLNLGFTAPESPKIVAANRRLFLRAVWGGRELPVLATLKQIHSPLVRRIGRHEAAALQRGLSQPAISKGDGLMTDQPGVLLGIQTADCLPVLVADRRRRAVAVFHAGWRGTVARIVEGGIGRMRLEFGSQPEDLIAAIGPGIGSCCYAVGDEVRQEFESQFDYASTLFREVYDSDPIKEKYPLLFMTARAPGHSDLGPRLHLDLAEANRRQLLAAGLPTKAIYRMDECTACQPDRFFSHRGEHGFTGRMMSVIGIRF